VRKKARQKKKKKNQTNTREKKNPERDRHHPHGRHSLPPSFFQETNLGGKSEENESSAATMSSHYNRQKIATSKKNVGVLHTT
jgi:hypothetical protein